MFSLTREDTSTPSATAAWLMQRVPEGTWVLQEYLMNPMTYRREGWRGREGGRLGRRGWGGGGGRRGVGGRG
jgi:hypothetical protein